MRARLDYTRHNLYKSSIRLCRVESARSCDSGTMRIGGVELTAEALFDEAVEPFRSDPRVTGETGFGSSPGRRVDGRIFAMLVRDDLVVKLPRQRVAELVESGVARWFDAGKGRPMREWASIDVASVDE